MDRPKKANKKEWDTFTQAVLRITPPKWVDAWNIARPGGKGPLQGGTLKHIITWLKDEEDQVNEVIIEFATAWENNTIVQRRGKLTGQKSGKRNFDGTLQENQFSFSCLGANLSGLPIHDIKELLTMCISGGMTWQDVCEVCLRTVFVDIILLMSRLALSMDVCKLPGSHEAREPGHLL